MYTFGGRGHIDETNEGNLDSLFSWDAPLSSWNFLTSSETANALSDYENNIIGSIMNAAMADIHGEFLYLIGGWYMDSTEFYYFNNLWRYNISGNNWEFLSGDGDLTSLTDPDLSTPYPASNRGANAVIDPNGVGF